MHVTCATLFVAFTFCYLYFYQCDLIAASQHILSGGQTHYDRLIGGCIVTLALFCVHLAFLAVSRLTYRAYALTFYPSLLILLIMTVVQIPDSAHCNYGVWVWLVPLLFVVVIAIAYLVRKYESIEKAKRPVGFFSKIFWSNLMLLVLGFFFVGAFSNHDDVFHYRMRMESKLLKHDYAGALEVGKKSLAADSSLTLLRVHALAKRRELGERLFEYPLVGGSKALKPNGSSVQTIMYPTYNFTQLPKADYILCGYLLDREIDAFAAAVGRFYASDSLLPRHYREALVLYNHARLNPVVSYRHDVLDADYADFQKLMRQIPDAQEHRARLRDVYGNTYWYYYFDTKRSAERQTSKVAEAGLEHATSRL